MNIKSKKLPNRKKEVAIVIPIYKTVYSPGEKISLKHLKKYLKKYDKYVMYPDHLNKKDFKLKGFKYIKFPRKHFVGIQSYSEFLLQEEFYKAFKNYKYILIYQLDALVFSDQLLKWCRSGYDYIAAPWFGSVIGTLTHKRGLPVSGGNGGFCLRNVQKSLEILRRVKKLAQRTSKNNRVRKIWFYLALLTGKTHKIWLNTPADDYPFNEDGFWALEAPKYLPNYKVAPFKKALEFSFEKFPEKCFELTKKKLPFGCHAWEKYNKEFWLPHLLR